MSDAVAVNNAVLYDHLSEQQVMVRRRMFYGVFIFLFALYAAIVLTYLAGMPEVSGFFMRSVVFVAPTIMQDVPLVGDLVPAVLGGIIAATAPPKASNRQLLTVLAFSFFTYVMYLHMTVFFTIDADGNFLTQGLKTTLADEGLDPERDAVILASFASSARNFASFVFAALIGIKFNDSKIVAVPFQAAAPRMAPEDIVDAPVVVDEAAAPVAEPAPARTAPQGDGAPGGAGAGGAPEPKG